MPVGGQYIHMYLGLKYLVHQSVLLSNLARPLPCPVSTQGGAGCPVPVRGWSLSSSINLLTFLYADGSERCKRSKSRMAWDEKVISYIICSLCA